MLGGKLLIGLARFVAVANGTPMFGIELPLMVLRKVLIWGILAFVLEEGNVACISGWFTTLGLAWPAASLPMATAPGLES